MSLKITNTAAAYSNSFPVYGHIVDQSNLKLALRTTGYSNLVDLSPQENTFEVGSDVVFTSAGPRSLASGAGIRSSYAEQDDSFTMLGCIKIDKSTRSTLTGDQQYRAYAFGSYSGATSFGGGAAVSVITSANSGTPDTFDTYLRFSTRLKNRSTGLYGPVTLNIALSTAQVTPPSTTDWLWVSLTFNHVTGEAVLKILNTGLEVRQTYSPVTWFTDAVNRGVTFEATGLPLYHRSGAANFAYVQTERNEVYVPEYMLYAGVLSDTVISTQYEASKKWLLAARGITLE